MTSMRVVRAFAFGTALALPLSAKAATTFDFRSTVSGTDCTVARDCGVLNGPDGNTRTFSSSGITLTASGFRLTGTVPPGSGKEIAFLGQFSSGLGVTNQNEGNGNNNRHIVDNVGSFDFIEMSFDKSVKVTSLTLTVFEASPGAGGDDTDADITYSFGDPLTSTRFDQNVGNGRDGGNGIADGNIVTINIAAANQRFSDKFNLFASLTAVSNFLEEDGFKVTSITVETVSIPAALPMLLAAAAGLGFAGWRRQRATA